MSSRQFTDPLELRHAATDRATIVVVPERTLLAIEGVGSPDADDFWFATDLLRKVGESLRSHLHRDLSIDTPVSAIESVWRIPPEVLGDEIAAAFADRSGWHWQQMIEIPHVAGADDAEEAIDEIRRHAGRSTPLVRLIRITEGRTAQILHVGGPATKPESVRKLYQALADAGLRPRGYLHEIHLSRADRVAAGRARSIIRMAIEPT